MPSMTSQQSRLVRHYLDHVLQRQYLLADTSIADFIIRTVQQSPAVRDAVCLLASLHQESLRLGNPSSAQSNALILHNMNEPSADLRKTYSQICDNLRTSAAGGYTEGEAMAGLFVVSAFLFRGGHGAWHQFLSVAAEWVWTVLHTGVDAAETILRCSDSQQFVIKTTFWFDILASTTHLEPPRFLDIYRKLWSPRRGAYIEGTSSGGCGAGGSGISSSSGACPGTQPPSTLSMMSVMGCENETALAIAETSALACWKAAHVRQGTLSVPDLVDRGRTIETECLPPRLLSPPHAARQVPAPPPPVPPHQVVSPQRGVLLYPAAGGGGGGGGGGADDLAEKRRLTADIFRATARVYLHSVLSGEHPGCPEIREGVRETIECLRRLSSGVGGQSSNSGSSGSSSVASSVLRSVVFGICLCGCLADDPDERDFLLRRLDEEEQAEGGVGNCASARAVMQMVWSRRDPGGGGGGGPPLSWREATQQFGGDESLLLV
ncbi:fungal-specific transcription factor domain-containing protein [Russula compacta]|nr:fungal-specific transcription factor domain-containing protein [Russula compacta]